MKLSRKISFIGMLALTFAASLIHPCFSADSPQANAASVETTTNAELTEFFGKLKAKQRQTVVVYGTSLTELGAWTGEVKFWFDQKFPGQVNFINSGLSGKNSDDGLAQLKTKVLDRSPDLVFIEFAINDAVTRFKIDPAKSLSNLDKMVEAIRAQNPQVSIVLQTMNHTWDAPNGGKSASNRPELETYYENYRAYAREHKLLLLDHELNWKQLQATEPEKYQKWLPDGTHPSKEGSQAITWPLIRRTLQSAANPLP